MNKRARSLLMAAAAGAALAAAAMVVVVVVLHEPATSPGAEQYASGAALPALWSAPDFTLADQHGVSTSSSSLRGAPYIADFIFTTCTNACPLITSRMVLLQRALTDVDVRFVSFSVDPAHDTPAALATYAERWNKNESRWSLFATTPDTLHAVADGFHVTAEATADVDDPILHSEVFFLVDADGTVRSIANSHDSAALQRLTDDARALATTQNTATNKTNDVSLSSLGCLGCHDVARVAPPLTALRGAQRMMADGRVVDVDADYLKRAIVEPSSDVVSGYPAIMPSYRAQLDDTQLATLIDELLARDVGGALVDAKIVIDPVCKMEVRATDDAPHVEHKGEHVYFCAEVCRDAFVADPARYGG